MSEIAPTSDVGPPVPRMTAVVEAGPNLPHPTLLCQWAGVRFRVGFDHAHQARARFTVLDLALLLGLLPDAALEILARWA